MIQSRWIQNVLLGFAGIILVLLTWWGITNAIKSAKSKRIVKDAQTMQAGFSEFYKNQNRYPSTAEFLDVEIMRPYLNNFPPQQFPSKECSQSYDYYNATSQTYELRFCLPKAVKGFRLGWNILKP